MPNRKDKKRGPKYEVRGGAPTRSNDSRSNAPSQNFKNFPHEMLFIYTVVRRIAQLPETRVCRIAHLCTKYINILYTLLRTSNFLHICGCVDMCESKSTYMYTFSINLYISMLTCIYSSSFYTCNRHAILAQ